MGIGLGYIRRSASEESPVSEDAQRAAIERLAAERGDTIEHVYRDWGRSGGSETRPEYVAMLARLEANGVSAVYAYDQDRLARSNWLFAGLLRLADLHDLAVVTPAGNLADDSRRDFAEMRGVMDGAELRKIRRRNRAIADRRQARGDDRGALPYGYGPRPGRAPRSSEPVEYVVVNPEGIAHVLDTYRRVGSYIGAARALNAEHFPSQRNGTWHATTVKGVVLRNAPALAASVRKGTRRTGRPRLFAGLLRCRCGGIMSPGTMHGKDSYYCGAGQRGLHGAPYAITEARLEPILREEAGHLRVPYDQLETAGAGDDAVEDIESRRRRLVDALEAGVLTAAELGPRIAALEAERDRLEALQTAIRAIPQRIDWSWSPERLGAALRALWRRVDVDITAGTAVATWAIPEWRAP